MNDEEVIDKEKVTKFEGFIRKNRMYFAIVFGLILLIGIPYLGMNYEKAFSKTYFYETSDGLWKCNDTYLFGKNITPLCDPPEQYKDGNNYNQPDTSKKIDLNLSFNPLKQYDK